MTDIPPPLHRKDPAWEAAMDWLFRVQESPDDVEVQQALSAWLREAPEHLRAYRKAEKVWGLAGTVMSSPTFDCEIPPSPPVLPAATLLLPRPRQRRRWLRRTGIGGALAACLLVLGLLDWQGLSADYHSPTGEHRQVTLADGSSVDLDSGAAIDVQFNDDKRTVILLRGQAFFDVKSQPERPFEVHAESVKVTVTGTAFAVEYAPGTIEVSVARGSVRAADQRHPDRPEQALKPGQGVRFARQGDAVQALQLPVEQIAAWRQWQMLVIDQPLSTVVERLRQYQPGLILLNDTALGDRRITAALDLHSPHEALRVAIAPLQAKVTRIGPYVLRITPD